MRFSKERVRNAAFIWLRVALGFVSVLITLATWTEVLGTLRLGERLFGELFFGELFFGEGI
jgi:hypothetical protein